MCDILLDMAWEKLNTGYWKDVHLDWRRVYTVVSVIKVFCQCCLLKQELDTDSLEVADAKNETTTDVKIENLADVKSEAIKDVKNQTIDVKNKMTTLKQGEDQTLVTDEKIPLFVDKQETEMLILEKSNKIFEKDKKKPLVSEMTNNNDTLQADTNPETLLGKKEIVNKETATSTINKNKTLLTENGKYSGVETSLADILKSCDMGLLMGAPIMDNILSKLSTKIHSVFANPRKRNLSTSENERDESDAKTTKLDNERKGTTDDEICNIKLDNQREEIITDKSRFVERVSCPSLESFKKNYMDTDIPVIVTDAIYFWPALGERKWTLDYLKENAGYRTVPIELGSKYTEESWSQDLLTVNEFIEKYIENENPPSKGYLAQHQLFEQVPQLRDDIVVPTYCCLGDTDDVETNAWFGPKGTVSPLHYDAKHNLLAQVVGHKYIRLYSNEHVDSLYPHPDRLLFNTSQVDVEAPDFAKFPLFADVPYTECVLRTGEMLYIPPKCWHFVRSLSVSFSVSFWWE